MQTWTVGGAEVRWDVGDTGGLEGYEGLRGERHKGLHPGTDHAWMKPL